MYTKHPIWGFFNITLLKLITDFSQSDGNALPSLCNIMEYFKKKSNAYGHGNVMPRFIK